MSAPHEEGQGDIIGLVAEIIGALILIWLFFIVILPALFKATAH
jgi:hypothetical protein